MTAAVLDKPAVLAEDDFAISCALHEIANKPQCERPAALIVRVHSCLTTFSCKECWAELMKQVKTRAVARDMMSTGSIWRCAMCGKKAKTFEQLIWSEPL